MVRQEEEGFSFLFPLLLLLLLRSRRIYVHSILLLSCPVLSLCQGFHFSFLFFSLSFHPFSQREEVLRVQQQSTTLDTSIRRAVFLRACRSTHRVSLVDITNPIASRADYLTDGLIRTRRVNYCTL